MDKTMIRRLRWGLRREMIIDLEDRLRAEGRKAFRVVRDGTGLNKKRARELEGQARFRMMEQGFEEVCTLHGGRLLEGGVLPDTDLRVFQPYVRFETPEGGLILGLAAMPEPKAVPAKNKSRLAGASINYALSPRLDLDGSGPRIGDVFVLLLFSRDRDKAGELAELAVGVVNSKYEAFLFYEPFEAFLSGELAPSLDDAHPTSRTATGSIVKLKPRAKPFRPPELPSDNHEETGPA